MSEEQEGFATIAVFLVGAVILGFLIHVGWNLVS